MKTKNLHIAGESIALFFVPALFEIADKQEDISSKNFLRVLAIGTIFIDGYLLYNYLK